MDKKAEYFDSINEPYASGFFEDEDRNKFYRYSKATYRMLERGRMPDYLGGKLYPSGAKVGEEYVIIPCYSHTVMVKDYNRSLLEAKLTKEAVETYWAEMHPILYPKTPHIVAGFAFTHSFPNYARIEKEGLDTYRERILKLEDSDFKQGLLLLLDGIDLFRGRCLIKLREENAPEELISALEQVPFKPARSLYEALVCRNFIYYMDFCDNPGRIDAELIDYYKGEDVTDILIEFFKNVDINDGWSLALGPDYTPLTIQVLKASRGIRRPSVELRVTDGMSDEIWDEAIKTVKAGGGSPVFYNEALYQKCLKEKFPYIPDEDLIRFNGGGCTETMLAGISRVGSVDAGINTTLVLKNSMYKYLTNVGSFEEFYEKYFDELDAATGDTLEKLNFVYRQRIEHMPQPMRTLLVDDCIDKQTEFNAGGARYNWSIINFAGIINSIDSLLAIRELIFDKKVYGAEEFMSLLDDEDEIFFRRLKKCPCFGVDDNVADSLAAEFSERLFKLLDNYKPEIGDCFIPASIQHIHYVLGGRQVGATPDGRRKQEPLADSLGAVHNKDIKGPTALLNSVTKLKLSMALGTPVLNLSILPEHIDYALKPLIRTYFANGGMQVQISCVSEEDLRDAMEHPERHENLIVRVGGYSEYFNRLSDEMKKSFIARTIQKFN